MKRKPKGPKYRNVFARGGVISKAMPMPGDSRTEPPAEGASA